MDKRTLAAVLAVAMLVGATPAVLALTGGTPQQGETPVATPQSPTIILSSPGSYTDVDLQDYAQGSTLDLETANGNITVTGDPGASALLDYDDITGTQTQVTQVDAGAAWLNLDPADKNRVDVRGDVDTLSFKSITPDDGATDIQVGGTQGGTAEFRLYGLAATTQYGLYDASRDEVLGTVTTDGSGDTGAFEVSLPDGTQALDVRTVDDFADPTLSNPDPTGTVTSKPTQLAVDVGAGAFPADVTLRLEGSVVTDTTVTSNGTVTGSISVDDLGTYEWSAAVTDAFGQTTTLNTSFETPSNITLREETRPQTIVNNSTATIRFFSVDGDIAIRRQTDDGKLNLTGLPDSEFVAFVESPNHYDRRVYLPNIYEQRDIFLLNSSRFSTANDTAIISRFIYEDFTGEFPQSKTTIQIQRAIDLNGDNRSEYRTIAGDYWGASNEFEATLEYGERYRIVLVNQETGARNIAGAHVPTADLTQSIRVTGLVEEAANASGVVGLADYNESVGRIDIAYSDAANETEELTVRVKPRGGGDAIYNDTVSGPLGTYSTTVTLNESQQAQDWVVVFDAGQRHRSAVPVGSGAVAFPVAFPGWLVTMLGAMLVTFVGGLYGPRTALLGAWAMWFVAAGLALFGWAFGGPSVVVAGLVAVGVTLWDRAVP